MSRRSRSERKRQVSDDDDDEDGRALAGGKDHDGDIFLNLVAHGAGGEEGRLVKILPNGVALFESRGNSATLMASSGGQQISSSTAESESCRHGGGSDEATMMLSDSKLVEQVDAAIADIQRDDHLFENSYYRNQQQQRTDADGSRQEGRHRRPSFDEGDALRQQQELSNGARWSLLSGGAVESPPLCSTADVVSKIEKSRDKREEPPVTAASVGASGDGGVTTRDNLKVEMKEAEPDSSRGPSESVIGLDDQIPQNFIEEIEAEVKARTTEIGMKLAGDLRQAEVANQRLLDLKLVAEKFFVVTSERFRQKQLAADPVAQNEESWKAAEQQKISALQELQFLQSLFHQIRNPPPAPPGSGTTFADSSSAANTGNDPSLKRKEKQMALKIAVKSKAPQTASEEVALAYMARWKAMHKISKLSGKFLTELPAALAAQKAFLQIVLQLRPVWNVSKIPYAAHVLTESDAEYPYRAELTIEVCHFPTRFWGGVMASAAPFAAWPPLPTESPFSPTFAELYLVTRETASLARDSDDEKIVNANNDDDDDGERRKIGKVERDGGGDGRRGNQQTAVTENDDITMQTSSMTTTTMSTSSLPSEVEAAREFKQESAGGRQEDHSCSALRGSFSCTIAEGGTMQDSGDLKDDEIMREVADGSVDRSSGEARERVCAPVGDNGETTTCKADERLGQMMEQSITGVVHQSSSSSSSLSAGGKVPRELSDELAVFIKFSGDAAHYIRKRFHLVVMLDCLSATAAPGTWDFFSFNTTSSIGARRDGNRSTGRQTMKSAGKDREAAGRLSETTTTLPRIRKPNGIVHPIASTVDTQLQLARWTMTDRALCAVLVGQAAAIKESQDNTAGHVGRIFLARPPDHLKLGPSPASCHRTCSASGKSVEDPQTRGCTSSSVPVVDADMFMVAHEQEGGPVLFEMPAGESEENPSKDFSIPIPMEWSVISWSTREVNFALKGLPLLRFRRQTPRGAPESPFNENAHGLTSGGEAGRGGQQQVFFSGDGQQVAGAQTHGSANYCADAEGEPWVADSVGEVDLSMRIAYVPRIRKKHREATAEYRRGSRAAPPTGASCDTPWRDGILPSPPSEAAVQNGRSRMDGGVESTLSQAIAPCLRKLEAKAVSLLREGFVRAVMYARQRLPTWAADIHSDALAFVETRIPPGSTLLTDIVDWTYEEVVTRLFLNVAATQNSLISPCVPSSLPP